MGHVTANVFRIMWSGATKSQKKELNEITETTSIEDESKSRMDITCHWKRK